MCRWNVTFQNWQSGNLKSPDNTFIDYYTMIQYYQALQSDYLKAQNQGYLNVNQGFITNFADFSKKLFQANTGNTHYSIYSNIYIDSCFILNLESSKHEIISGDSFLLTLTLFNTQSTSITNIDISLAFTVRSTSAPVSNRFSVTNTTIAGITGNVNGAGTLAPSEQATIIYQVTSLSVPMATTGTYNAGGYITYSQNSKTYNISIFEAIVVNYPPPQLQIHYFLPSSFNDTVTTNMAMVVANSGYGNAYDVTIDTVRAAMVDLNGKLFYYGNTHFLRIY
jgi:hypothetical protein